jgi:hypothetical protein
MDKNRQNGYERKIGYCKHMWNTIMVSSMKVSKEKSWQQNDFCKCDWKHISGENNRS